MARRKKTMPVHLQLPPALIVDAKRAARLVELPWRRYLVRAIASMTVKILETGGSDE